MYCEAGQQGSHIPSDGLTGVLIWIGRIAPQRLIGKMPAGTVAGTEEVDWKMAPGATPDIHLDWKNRTAASKFTLTKC